MTHPRPPLWLLLASLIAAAPSAAAAQPPASPAPASNITVDPIRCWWRSEGAIRTGQRFDVVMTCAVVDNDAVQVVPDETRLSPEVVQMAPFEVLGGSHPADMRSGARRFFQYVYSLRIINPDSIGKDVALPPLEIHYRVTSRLSENAALQGRDLVYLLPSTDIRVLSLVPANAADIREASAGAFADVESLMFRERLMRLGSGAFLALGVVMTVLALVPLVRRRQTTTPTAERLVPVSAVLRRAARELDHVRQSTEQSGWNEALVAQALSAARLAAAIGLGHDPAQTAASEQSGGLAVVSGRLGARTGRTVWSAITSRDVAAALDSTNNVAPRRRQPLEQLQAALAAMTRARFGRSATDARESLDEALSTSAEAVRTLSAEYRWPMSILRERRRARRQTAA